MVVFRLTVTGTADADTQCNQYDFSPCSCDFYNSTNSYYITCIGAPMVDVAAVFQTKPALNIQTLQLYIRPEGDYIPANLLGPSQFLYSSVWGSASCFLYINGYSEYPASWVVVDPNAFHSPEHQNSSIFNFFVNFLDTSRLDFQFLSHVGSNLKEIRFSYLTNLEKSLPTLPYLPVLNALRFEHCLGLDKAFSGSFLNCNGLESIATFDTCEYTYFNVY